MKSALQMKSLRDEVRIADYVACFMHAVREGEKMKSALQMKSLRD